jgi:hypothetical protein
MNWLLIANYSKNKEGKPLKLLGEKYVTDGARSE